MEESVLSKILAAKKRRVAAGQFTERSADVARVAAGLATLPGTRPEGARFTASLSPLSKQNLLSSSSSFPLFLAEIKHRSPSAGLIFPDAPARIEEIARAYRRGGASALSVVVEQDFFGGDPSWLPRAKRASGLPVLMKDFVVDETQLDFAAALGADAVLLLAAALDDAVLTRLHAAASSRALAVLVEAHDEVEIGRALGAGAEIVGVNSRDLKTFDVDLPGMARLGALLPASVSRVAESGIKSRGDVELLAAAGYGAFLVGETLLKAPDPAAMLRTLRGENPTEIKVCGITREEDVDACLEQGVDWIGLVFAPRSPRRLTPEEGRLLRMRAKGERDEEGNGRFLRMKENREGGPDPASGPPPGSVKGVIAVFDGNADEEILRVVELVRPDVLQMANPPLTLQKKSFSSDLAIWNTIRVGRDDFAALAGRAGDALHFDTSVGGSTGGTGTTFDWNLLSDVDRSRPLVLAGGLTPGNVANAVRRARPDVVDVSSGVESAPGVKDPAKIAAFVREVRSA